VTWTAPSSNGGSPITSYVVTPSSGSPVTVTGSPPATSTVVTGLANGTPVTFTVAAVNNIGTSAPSAPSNSVTPTVLTPPAFRQAVSTHLTAVTVASVAPASAVASGGRLVVLVGVWGNSSPTAKTVTDSAGNTYTEVLRSVASDQTELSVWTAPITAGGGTKPTVKVTPSARADVGVSVLEYSGMSTAAGLGAIDGSATGTGTTIGSAGVSSASTPPTTGAGEVAVGFYVDSGFGDTLIAGAGFTSRVNVSATSDIELAVEDQPVALGAAAKATFGTGPDTPWLVGTVVFKHL